MGIAEFVDYLKNERRLSLHTLRAYQNDLEEFQAFLSERFNAQLSDAASVHIRFWLSSLLQNKLSTRSINRKNSTLKSFFKFLEIKGSFKVNPIDKVVSPKNPRKLADFVPEASMEKLLKDLEFPEGFQGVRDRLILETFYTTGIRLSEIVNLRRRDIDIYSSQIKVLGKGNKERIIPVLPSLIATIKEYYEARRDEGYDNVSEYFILTDKGKKAYPKFVYRKVNFYLSTTSSVNKKSPHILRHTFATHMLNNGADINAIKELLGHTSLAATQVYSHNTVERIKSIYKQAHPKA